MLNPTEVETTGEVVQFHSDDADVRYGLTDLGEATVAVIRAKRRATAPILEAELQAIAKRWGVRIDDLWPALAAEREAGRGR